MTARVDINGPFPPKGESWCYTCVAQYMGTVTQSDEWQEAVKKHREESEEKGHRRAVIYLPGPEVTGGRLNEAVTMGPSIWAPGTLAGVCWDHILPIKPDDELFSDAAKRLLEMKEREQASGLIKGKANEVP